ncbi:Dis3-like exonuclease 2 [Globisporangium polare]
MEHRKKKEKESSGGGAGRGGKGRGGGGAAGGGSKRVVIPWEDAMHDSDEDAKPAQAVRSSVAVAPAGVAPLKQKSEFAVKKPKRATQKSEKAETRAGEAEDAGESKDANAAQSVKKEKKKSTKQEKQAKKKPEVTISQLELKQRKEKKKKKKKLAKLEKQAKKKADIDDDGHIDDDVAFDSDDIASDDDAEGASDSGGDFDDLSLTDAHGFVMIDLENDMDELALVADMASGGGGSSALLHFVQSEIKKSKKDKKKKKKKQQQEKAVAVSTEPSKQAVKTGEKLEKAKKKEKKKSAAAKKEVARADSFAVIDLDDDISSEMHDSQPQKMKKDKKKKKTKTVVVVEVVSTSGKAVEKAASKSSLEEAKSEKAAELEEKTSAKKAVKQAKKEAQQLQEATLKSERRKERGRKAKGENVLQGSDDRSFDKRKTTGTPVYVEYAEHETVLEGLENGTYFQGRLRVNSRYRMDGYVTVDGISMDILVKGMEDRNRAFDGDLVAIELLPDEEWKPLKTDKGKEGGESKPVVKPTSSSAPIDTSKLHSLWLPSIESAKCFVERREGEEKQVGGDTDVRTKIAAIKEKIAALQFRPTGKVVYILAQGNTQGFIGSLEPKTKPKDADTPLPSEDSYAYFNAQDERLPRRIQIPRLQLPDEFVSHPLAYSKTMLCFCRMKSWSTKYKSPMGEFVKTLGEFTGIESGISAILMRHDILSHTLDFDSEILDELDAKYGVSGEKWAIPDEEVQKRRDFRNYQIFSIDPYNARDLDDALHVRALNKERTKFEIGVHIADVTHFIETGSLLDKKAQDRATSVYLVNRVLPMLPRVLCEKLCSLQPQVDRLAFSVVWQMNADGTLVDGCEPWFGKSIIRSCCKLDYGSAQRMLDGSITDDNLELWEEDRRPIVGENAQITNASVIQSVKDLWTIGKCRRESRFDTGAISLNNVKIVFTLDAKGNPATFGSYQLKDSNRLVEEYMLLANYLVAQQLLRAHGPLAFIRNHAPPITGAMEQTLEHLQENKMELDGTTTKSLSESLEQVRIKHGETAYVIAQALIIKPMKPAEYMVAGNGDSPEAWRHYALNIPYYTHFTSPIRRFADVVVHRLLQESLTCGDTLPVDNPTRDVSGLLQAFTAVSQNCNDKKTTAKHAETECDLVFLCAYVKNHGAVEVTGVVMSTGPQSFTVYIMELGLEERIFLKNADLTGTYDEKTSNLAIRLPAAKLKQGDKASSAGNGTSKPIQLSFMTKLRLRMCATEKMPLKLEFTVLGEKSS